MGIEHKTYRTPTVERDSKLDFLNTIYLVSLLLTISLFSCEQNPATQSDNGEDTNEADGHSNFSISPDQTEEITTETISGDTALRLYNIKYVLSINPAMNETTDEFTVNIELKTKEKRIFRKFVGKELLAETMISAAELRRANLDAPAWDTVDAAFFKTLKLASIQYRGVRANELYFDAVFESDKQNVGYEMVFQINYLRRIGDLHVNRFERIAFL